MNSFYQLGCRPLQKVCIMQQSGNDEYLFPVQPPSAQAQPQRLPSYFYLCCNSNRPAKRYPYFPPPKNMDTIVYHPTPAKLPAGRKNIEAPAPQGAGALQCYLSAKSSMGAWCLKIAFNFPSSEGELNSLSHVQYPARDTFYAESGFSSTVSFSHSLFSQKSTPRPSRATEAGFVANRTFAAMPNRWLVLLDKTSRLWHNAPAGLMCAWSVQEDSERGQGA